MLSALKFISVQKITENQQKDFLNKTIAAC